ncbi:MAG TPA: 4-alpha-glucanotransferase [Phycisphaerales bacterium]|nr:4-alpha-glucanotransferase [Phycisphaerales bacterium]
MPPRVLMLGWEFPPFITGGLGTACFGLTKALDRLGVETTFVLPKSTPIEDGSHVKVISPGESARKLMLRKRAKNDASVSEPSASVERKPVSPPSGPPSTQSAPHELETLKSIETELHRILIPNDNGVYPSLEPAMVEVMKESSHEIQRIRTMVDMGILEAGKEETAMALFSALPEAGPPKELDEEETIDERPSSSADYSGDLIGQAEHYARFCSMISKNIDFDVIHAHDWLTYPAGLAVSRISGKPLVVHVHSTEFDRSGEHVNQVVYNIERRGMHGASKVIAVSHLTREIVENRYGIEHDKVNVVWNGIDVEPAKGPSAHIRKDDKIVLYFGRITHQKGPEYFIAAAKRVLDLDPNVKFVVAGSGDLAERMIRMAAELGIGHKVLFTGFLRGDDIRRVFSLADLYVMPSVSEPFGIAPLEAMSHDVPALISKSSGVSEVLTHALKVDFWDVEEMANKIVAVLRHSPLSKALRDNGRFEVRALTWDGAATRCRQVYESVLAPWSASTPAR